MLHDSIAYTSIWYLASSMDMCSIILQSSWSIDVCIDLEIADLINIEFAYSSKNICFGAENQKKT